MTHPSDEKFGSVIDGTSSFDQDGDDRLEITSPEGKLVLSR